MAIEVVRGCSHGKVLLIDRKEDGTIVLLVCEGWEPGSEPVGPTFSREHEPDEDGIFPMALPVGRERIGRLILDITALSPGLQAFASERFCEAAIGLIREGMEQLVLQPRDSERLGFRASLSDEASASS